MTPFDRRFERLMILEGHVYTNHPDDLGGPTKFGISTLAYPDEDIEHITLARAKFLYERDYDKPLLLNAVLDSEIAFQLFESAVHMDPPGQPRRAVKIAQGALIIHGVNVVFDGVMGPLTVGAINSYPFKPSLLKWMNLIQGAALLVGAGGEDELVASVKKRLHQLQVNGRGWGRRLVV